MSTASFEIITVKKEDKIQKKPMCDKDEKFTPDRVKEVIFPVLFALWMCRNAPTMRIPAIAKYVRNSLFMKHSATTPSLNDVPQFDPDYTTPDTGIIDMIKKAKSNPVNAFMRIIMHEQKAENGGIRIDDLYTLMALFDIYNFKVLSDFVGIKNFNTIRIWFTEDDEFPMKIYGFIAKCDNIAKYGSCKSKECQYYHPFKSEFVSKYGFQERRCIMMGTFEHPIDSRAKPSGCSHEYIKDEPCPFAHSSYSFTQKREYSHEKTPQYFEDDDAEADDTEVVGAYDTITYDDEE